jgi:hypothetical protein
MEGEDKDWRRGNGTGKLRRLVARAVELELEILDRVVVLRVVNMLESDSESLVLSIGERRNRESRREERAGLETLSPRAGFMGASLAVDSSSSIYLRWQCTCRFYLNHDEHHSPLHIAFSSPIQTGSPR